MNLYLLALIVITAHTVFAGGRVFFSNDSNRLVYFNGANGPTAYTPSVSAEFGIPIYCADLYVGSTADTLVYSGVTSSSWSTTVPGTFNSVVGFLPDAYPGGMDNKWFFQVVVRPIDVSPSTGSPLPAMFEPVGFSQVFQAFASTSAIVGNSIVSTGSPSYSTWAPGTVPVIGSVPGAMGAISFVPEPLSGSLGTLGIAMALLLRRKHPY